MTIFKTLSEYANFYNMCLGNANKRLKAGKILKLEEQKKNKMIKIGYIDIKDTIKDLIKRI